MTIPDATEQHLTQSQLSKPLVSIAIVFIVVVALFFIVRALPLDTLGEIRPKRFTWWVIPVVLLLQLIFLVIAADVYPSYMQLAVVTVGKYVPGKVWGFVARAAEMSRFDIPLHLSVMSSIVEQLLLLMGALVVATVAALMIFPDYRLLLAVAGAALLVAGVITISNVPALTKWMLRRKNIQNIPTSFDSYDAAKVFKFVLVYAFLWILSGLIFAVIYFSLFDVTPNQSHIAVLNLANTTGTVAGFFALFAPGGLGVREAISTTVLAGFVPLREALLAAITYRAWLIAIDCVNVILIIARQWGLAKHGKIQS